MAPDTPSLCYSSLCFFLSPHHLSASNQAGDESLPYLNTNLNTQTTTHTTNIDRVAIGWKINSNHNFHSSLTYVYIKKKHTVNNIPFILRLCCVKKQQQLYFSPWFVPVKLADVNTFTFSLVQAKQITLRVKGTPLQWLKVNRTNLKNIISRNVNTRARRRKEGM